MSVISIAKDYMQKTLVDDELDLEKLSHFGEKEPPTSAQLEEELTHSVQMLKEGWEKGGPGRGYTKTFKSPEEVLKFLELIEAAYALPVKRDPVHANSKIVWLPEQQHQSLMLNLENRAQELNA